MKYAVLKCNTEYCTNDIVAVKNTQEEAIAFIKNESVKRLQTLCGLSVEEADRQYEAAVDGKIPEHITGSDGGAIVFIYYDTYEESYHVSEFGRSTIDPASYSPEDIARVFCQNVSQMDDFDDIQDALYHIKSCAENPMNASYWRKLWEVLQKMAEREDAE